MSLLPLLADRIPVHCGPSLFRLVQTEQHRRRYAGTYAKRGGNKPDGCATLWRADMFRLVAEHTIHFSEHELRDNVAVIVILEARQPPAVNGSEAGRPRRLILGNCHILFNPKRGTHIHAHKIWSGRHKAQADVSSCVARPVNDIPVAGHCW